MSNLPEELLYFCQRRNLCRSNRRDWNPSRDLRQTANRALHIRCFWTRANPFTALAKLRQLKGVEMLLWVMGLSILAQFCLHTSWFLYTEFKFGWTPKDNGLSLFAVGIVSVISQGVLARSVLDTAGPVSRKST